MANGIVIMLLKLGKFMYQAGLRQVRGALYVIETKLKQYIRGGGMSLT